MNEIFLAVIFMFNGIPTMVDGWEPREYPSMEICNLRKSVMEDYISAHDFPEVGVIYCGTKEQIQHQVRILNSEPV